MRVALIFLVPWFHGIASEFINRDPANPRIKNECLIEYGIEPDINYNSQEGVSPLTEEEMYCVAACIYRDVGIMKSNGKIDTQKVEDYFGPDDSEEKKIFFFILDACHDGNIHCSLVQCMFRELTNYAMKSSTPSSMLKHVLSGQNKIKFL